MELFQLHWKFKDHKKKKRNSGLRHIHTSYKPTVLAAVHCLGYPPVVVKKNWNWNHSAQKRLSKLQDGGFGIVPDVASRKIGKDGKISSQVG